MLGQSPVRAVIAFVYVVTLALIVAVEVLNNSKTSLPDRGSKRDAANRPGFWLSERVTCMPRRRAGVVARTFAKL